MSGLRLRLPGRPLGRVPAAGPARLLEAGQGPEPRDGNGAGEPRDERVRLAEAFEAADRELSAFPAGTPARGLMEAQRSMLADPVLRAACEVRLARGLSAPAAVRDAIEDLAALLDQTVTAWPGRGADLRDLGARLARAMGAPARLDLAAAGRGEVALASELLPSEVAALARAGVAGFVTAGGAPESHASLLAEALGLPGMVGVPGLMAVARAGERVVIDPAAREVRLGGRGGPPRARRDPGGAGWVVSRDGEAIELAASAGSPAEVERARAAGVAGVDLYRTELGWMGRGGEFDREAASQDYRAALAAAGLLPLVFRTLDLGGDKEVPGRAPRPGRGLARWLGEPGLARLQLGALREVAGAGGVAGFRVLLPRVESAAELEAARTLIEAAGLRSDEPPGAMIESPAGVAAAGDLAGRAGWLALGTSDLSAALAGPALSAAIVRTVEVARRAGTALVACGRLAADPVGLALLLAAGVRRVAVPPASAGRIRDFAATMDIRALAGVLGSGREISAADLPGS